MAVNNSRRYRTQEPSSSLPDKFEVTLTQWNDDFTQAVSEKSFLAKTMAQANKIKGDFEAEHFTNIGRIDPIKLGW